MWGIIASILIGALAGFIGGRIMGKGMGFIVCIIVGLIGGFLGSWIFSKIGIPMSEKWWGQLLVGTAGSVVLLFILSLFRRK